MANLDRCRSAAYFKECRLEIVPRIFFMLCRLEVVKRRSESFKDVYDGLDYFIWS